MVLLPNRCTVARFPHQPQGITQCHVCIVVTIQQSLYERLDNGDYILTVAVTMQVFSSKFLMGGIKMFGLCRSPTGTKSDEGGGDL